MMFQKIGLFKCDPFLLRTGRDAIELIHILDHTDPGVPDLLGFRPARAAC